MISLDPASAALLPTFVSEAHANVTIIFLEISQHKCSSNLLLQGVNATLSIGGWGGSQYFSTAVAPANQSQFVQTVVKLATQYGLDGIDFEYVSSSSPSISPFLRQ